MSRNPLISRVPEIWRRLDHDGFLRRFLGVVDSEFDLIHDKIGELLTLKNVDTVPDKYLPLLAPFVGHIWRSRQSYDWNRRRIRDAIRRHSYKGTYSCLGDLVSEYGGSWWDVTDMASRLWVWNRQGLLNRDDSHLMAANFWHDGAFVLHYLDDLDFENFLLDFDLTKPAGEVWFYNRIHTLTEDIVTEQVWDATYEIEQNSSRPVVGVFNFNAWNTFPGYPKAFIECEDAYPVTPTGSLITVGSNILVSRTDITVDQGVPGNPISSEAALLQTPATIVEETI